MQQYKYTAIDLQRKKFTGTFIAKDEKDLAQQLSKQNLFLVSCSVYSGGTPSAFFTLGTGTVSSTELTTFCRQFAIMINAGISILECLECLKEQSFSTFFRSLLQVIYDDVKTGMMFSDALNKHTAVFPDFFRNMVYVGEVGGSLESVFNSLADYYERDLAIKRKTKGAFAYPIMLAGMTVGIVILMMLYIVPTFRNSLSSLDVEPSGLTKAVYNTSDFLLAYWLYILAIIAVAGIGLFLYGRSKSGRFFFDALKLRTPLVQKITIDLITARFARGFSLMLTNGVDIVDALDAIVIVIGNKEFERRFRLATEDVKHGMKLTAAFEKHHLFPKMLNQMVSVGERTATLDEVLDRSCNFFDEQLETTINSVTSKIQPVMLCIMGVVIGTLFLAVYSPMLSIMQNI